MKYHLVACVGQKRTKPALAADLYQSDWFVKARAYVEAVGGPWFILSAKYGLVRPDEIIAPYDQTLNTMHAPVRRLWGEKVVQQLATTLPNAAQLVLLAGVRYRQPIEEWAGDRAYAPMAGLGIGQQKAWLISHTQGK